MLILWYLYNMYNVNMLRYSLRWEAYICETEEPNSEIVNKNPTFHDITVKYFRLQTLVSCT